MLRTPGLSVWKTDIDPVGLGPPLGRLRHWFSLVFNNEIILTIEITKEQRENVINGKQFDNNVIRLKWFPN
jgi:hypothetical protein